jgi:hypothetical protein
MLKVPKSVIVWLEGWFSLGQNACGMHSYCFK